MADRKQGEKKTPAAKPEVVIHGRKYRLRMGLWASEQIENEFGDLQEALRKFQAERSVSMIKKLFIILAQAGLKHEKKPMDVADDVLDDCTLHDLNEISKAMRAAMDESLHAETVNGNEADDEPQDALAAEYDEKNG